MIKYCQYYNYDDNLFICFSSQIYTAEDAENENDNISLLL